MVASNRWQLHTIALVQSETSLDRHISLFESYFYTLALKNICGFKIQFT